MLFNIYHMRNYDKYCETEESVYESTQRGVEAKDLETKVLEIEKSDIFRKETDWIEIFPSKEEEEA